MLYWQLSQKGIYMKQNLKKAFLALCLLCVIPVSYADLLVTDYKKTKGRPEELIIKVQINSIYEGFSYANIVLEDKDQQPLFCPPRQQPVSINILISIIDNQIGFYESITKGGLNPSLTIAPLMLSGLTKLFPCK